MYCRRAAHSDGGPELQSILDLDDLEEVFVVWDAQGTHAILVPPLLEVALKGPAPPVAESTADFTLELLLKKNITSS